MPVVTVLGGSGASVNTGRGCSGLLITDERSSVVLDLGPCTLLELRKHTDFRNLTGIVLSHLHLDHMLDLCALRFALKYNPLPPPARTPLWLPPDGLAFFDRLARAFDQSAEADTFFSDVFDLREYDPGETIHLGLFGLSFRPTVHYIPCWAMKVVHQPTGRALGYTADTGPSVRLDDFFANCALLVSEASLSEPEVADRAQSGHLTASEAGELARRANVQQLVVVHTYEEREPDRQRADAERAFGKPTVLGTAGMVIPW